MIIDNLQFFLIRPAVLRQKLFALKNAKMISPDEVASILESRDVCDIAVAAPFFMAKSDLITYTALSLSMNSHLDARQKKAIKNAFDYKFITPDAWLSKFVKTNYNLHTIEDFEFLIKDCAIPIKALRQEITAIALRDKNTDLLDQLLVVLSPAERQDLLQFEKSYNSIDANTRGMKDKSYIINYISSYIEKEKLGKAINRPQQKTISKL